MASPSPICCCSSRAGIPSSSIVKDVGDYERLGTTLDDALGEAFDKTAKLLGLGYPGGPEVERVAAQGRADASRCRGRCSDGRSRISRFAGLKTALRHEALARAPLSEQDVADLCASFQEAVADIVADRDARARSRSMRERLGAGRASARWWSPAASPPIRRLQAGARDGRAPSTASAWSCRRPRSAPTMPP